MEDKKIVLIDFDGVLHSYQSGWQGADTISDPPVDEAINFLRWLCEERDIEICIYSSRSRQDGGIDAMKRWLLKYGLEQGVLGSIRFPTQKPAAFLTVDDRCFCFRGQFPSVEYIKSFKSWYEKR